MIDHSHEHWMSIWDDTLLYETVGTVDGWSCTILCTNKQLIFTSKKFLRSLKERKIPIEWIKSEKIRSFLIFNSVVIDCGNFKYKIILAFNSDAEKLVKAIEIAQ